MMKQQTMQTLTAVTSVGAALLLAACASTSPQQDAHFGEASRQLYEQQRLHPDASRTNEGKPIGADGRTVKAGMDRMADSYRTPPANMDQTIGGIGNAGQSAR